MQRKSTKDDDAAMIIMTNKCNRRKKYPSNYYSMYTFI